MSANHQPAAAAPMAQGRRDLISTMQDYGIELVPRGSIFWARCPFHDDQRPSLHVDPRRGRGGSFHCYGCGVGGYEPTFRRLMGETSTATCGALPHRTRQRLPSRRAVERAASPADVVILDRALALWQEHAHVHQEASVAAMAYLSRRGFSPAAMRWHQIAAPGNQRVDYRLIQEGHEVQDLERIGLVNGTRRWERFRRRLVIPEVRHGHTVHMTGRRLDSKAECRYIDLNYDPLLWHLGCALRKKTGPVYVVEGQLDAIACCQAGLPAVATGSSSLSQRQLREIAWLQRRCGREIVAWGDADEAGQRLNTTLRDLGATRMVRPVEDDAAALLQQRGIAGVRAVATRLVGL